MATVAEAVRDVGFVLSEANGTLSRDIGTLAGGNGILMPGTVLKLSSGKYVPFDGTGTAVAILLYRADTTGGDVQAPVLVRNAEVVEADLIGVTSQAVTQLRQVGIICR